VISTRLDLVDRETLEANSTWVFIDVFWILGALSLAMIPLMFLIKSAPRPHEPVSPH
jgi:hypothetical protein